MRAFGQAWADAFRSSPDLTGVVHIYEELKRKGVEFPMADLDALSPIHTPQRVGGIQHKDSGNFTFRFPVSAAYRRFGFSREPQRWIQP